MAINKVLMVSEYENYGGCEIHIAMLRVGLAKAGIRTALVTKYADPTRAKQGGDYKSLTEALEKFQPDVVHLHNVGALTSALAYVVGMNIPHVLSLHDYWPFCPQRMMILNQMVCQQPCGENCQPARLAGNTAKELVQAAHARVTFNEGSANIFGQHGLDVETIPHGIDMSLYQPAAMKKGKVAFIASRPGYWEKGEHYYDAILGRDTHLEAKVIGQPHSTVRETLADAMVFIHAGLFQETFCLAVAEAMASGAVPIAFDTGGPRSLITPDTGVLVPVGDIGGAREALERLLRNPQETVTMGARARKRIKDYYNLDRMVRDYVRLYERVGGKSGGRTELCREDQDHPVRA